MNEYININKSFVLLGLLLHQLDLNQHLQLLLLLLIQLVNLCELHSGLVRVLFVKYYQVLHS